MSFFFHVNHVNRSQKGFARYSLLTKSAYLFLLLSFLLFPLSLFAQNSTLDSLQLLLSKEKDPSRQLEFINQLVAVAFRSDFQQALTYAKQGVSLSEKVKDKNWQPQFYEMQGRMHANLLQLDSATLFFDKAMVGYREVNNKKGQATTAFKIAWVFKKKGDIEKAMAADLEALRIMEELNDLEGIANANGRVSEDLYRQGRFAESLTYAQKAVDICEKNNLRGELFYAYRSVGDAYIGSKNPEAALDFYNKSLALTTALKMDEISIADITNCRGNAFKHLGRYEEAKQDYETCLAIAQKVNYPSALSSSLANLGEVHLRMGQYNEALPYQLKTIQLQEADNDLSNLLENYHHTSTIYEQLGDYKSALTYERKARALRDTTMTLQSDAAISELRTRYETEKKEATIALQEQQLSQKNLMQWLSTAVALVFGGLLFFLYRSYCTRMQTNKLLESKNAENELLLKEIHHRVKNNLEVVSSLLALQSAQIEDVSVKAAMQEGQNRVHSIGIVHQKLYQGKHLGTVEMKDYLVNLSESILDSFGAEGRVTIECAMDQLDVDIDTAIPLGLIVNELLTNTLKYAFPDGQKGKVRIQLEKSPTGMLYLRVADNGVGKGGLSNGTGFGSQLLSLLTQQLNGSMREEINNGTSFFFDFNLKKAAYG
jgi:two-component system, sensor histidine kinase PdtaS